MEVNILLYLENKQTNQTPNNYYCISLNNDGVKSETQPRLVGDENVKRFGCLNKTGFRTEAAEWTKIVGVISRNAFQGCMKCVNKFRKQVVCKSD